MSDLILSTGVVRSNLGVVSDEALERTFEKAPRAVVSSPNQPAAGAYHVF